MDPAEIQKLDEWFAAYCRSFMAEGSGDPRPYAVKKEHTRQVRENSAAVAEGLGLGQETVALADAVALFHDLGRFPQYHRYGTFRDSVSVNHAALSAQVLLEERVLTVLPERERRLITRAVTLHNVLTLPDRLDDETLLHTQLVRDADKLDIWRVFIEHYRLPEPDRTEVVVLGLPEEPHCTPAVLDRLGESKMVEHAMISTQHDFTLLQLSWVYDLNFRPSFRIMAERGYIDDLASTLPRNDSVRRAVDGVRAYVERKKR